MSDGGIQLFMSPTYGFLVGTSGYSGLTSIMTQELTRTVAPFGPQRLFESDSNSGPSQAIPMLNCNKSFFCLQDRDVSKQITLCTGSDQGGSKHWRRTFGIS